MHLSPIDWAILGAYIALALGAGALLAGRAGKDTTEYFLAGRRLPWWIAGTSMVATTFACDTPLVISGWVREFGIWQNWQWWCIALCNVLAVVLFARYWRRGQVMTTAELAELRYGGRSAKALRGVLGMFQAGITNTIILSWVLLAASKILDVMFELDKGTALLLASIIALSYSVMAGFWAVVVTDVVQFALAITGAVVLAVLAWHAIDGAEGVAAAVASGALLPERLSLLPPTGPGTWLDSSFWTIPVASMAVFLGVQWWAYEYVDGGIIAVQRISASRSERDGVLAMLWYNIAHYALRPWPWILVGVASLVMLPQVEVTAPFDGTIREVSSARGEERLVLAPDDGGEAVTVDLRALEARGVFGAEDAASGWYPTQVTLGGGKSALATVQAGARFERGDVIAQTDHERAYVVMLAGLLPVGLLGLAITALLAAFMSTIDTHVNLASSFFVNDVYRRFLRRDGSPSHYVNVGRLASVGVLALGAYFALLADSISNLFTFFLAFLSGVGPIYVLRWLWWRVKASTEIVAMVASSLTASTLKFAAALHASTGLELFRQVADYQWAIHGLSEDGALTPPGLLVITVAVSTSAALLSLLVTPKARPEALVTFYRRVRPAGAWGPVRALCKDVARPREAGPVLAGWLGGLMTIYGVLFSIGWYLFGATERSLLAAIVAFLGTHIMRSALQALPAYEERAGAPWAATAQGELSMDFLRAPDAPRIGRDDTQDDD
ncbi:MAG: sodium:solute symporter family protein [Planctomycetota bacterium]